MSTGAHNKTSLVFSLFSCSISCCLSLSLSTSLIPSFLPRVASLTSFPTCVSLFVTFCLRILLRVRVWFSYIWQCTPGPAFVITQRPSLMSYLLPPPCICLFFLLWLMILSLVYLYILNVSHVIVSFSLFLLPYFLF